MLRIKPRSCLSSNTTETSIAFNRVGMCHSLLSVKRGDRLLPLLPNPLISSEFYLRCQVSEDGEHNLKPPPLHMAKGLLKKAIVEAVECLRPIILLLSRSNKYGHHPVSYLCEEARRKQHSFDASMCTGQFCLRFC